MWGRWVNRGRLALGCVAVTLAGAMLVSGCGGSSQSTPSAPSQPICPGGTTRCISQSARATVIGPRDFTANLKWLMSENQPFLKRVQVSCPPPPRTYPVNCYMRAVDDRKRNRLIGGGRSVYGSLQVLGVYTVTHTYVYSLLFGIHG